jgi:predicted Zn-dependent peptidase
MVEDEPEELVHDLISAAVWPGHPLGQPVAGTPESVEALGRPEIMAWLGRHYSGPRLVVSAAGAVEHSRLADLLAARLKPRPEAAPRASAPPLSRPGLSLRRRKLEQAHLVVAADFPAWPDRRRHAASLLNLALGGNMSSRLFQEIRERRGLAYSVYSGYSAHQDAGRLEIYAGAAPEKIAETRRLILAELAALRAEPPSAAELAEAVDGLATGLILGGESTEVRMSRLAKNELIHGRFVALDEVLADLAAVTREDLLALAAEFLPEDRLSTCVLGPVTKKDI